MVLHHSQGVLLKLSQRFLKTGEFAAFCNTTKDTLFHYDDIGLLKPLRTAPNGYRYYSLNQIYMFDLITTLKELGLSLEQIKNYMDRRDSDAFVMLLKEQDKRLKAKIDQLTRRRRLLRNTLAQMRESFDVEEDVITVEEMPEEYFIISDPITNQSEKELFAVVSRHWDYCTKHNAYDDFVTGEIIPYENIVNGSFASSWYSSHIDKKIKSRYLHIKPAGSYATKYIRCSYYGLKEEYRKFCEEVTAMGYKICGDIYQNDITNYLSERYADDYLMRLEVRVER